MENALILYIILDSVSGESLLISSDKDEVMKFVEGYDSCASSIQLRIYNETTSGDLELTELIENPVCLYGDFATRTTEGNKK